MRRFIASVTVVVLAFSPALAADPEDRRIRWLDDGRIEVAGVQYDSAVEWHGSAEFRTNGHRCGAAAHDFPAPPAQADCSSSLTNPLPQYDPGTTYVIPVVFHVISNTSGVGTLSAGLIQSQIDVLNEDFLALAGTNGAPGTGVDAPSRGREGADADRTPDTSEG